MKKLDVGSGSTSRDRGLEVADDVRIAGAIFGNADSGDVGGAHADLDEAEGGQADLGTAEGAQADLGTAEGAQADLGTAEGAQADSGAAEGVQAGSGAAEGGQADSGAAEGAQADSGAAEGAQADSGDAGASEDELCNFGAPRPSGSQNERHQSSHADLGTPEPSESQNEGCQPSHADLGTAALDAPGHLQLSTSGEAPAGAPGPPVNRKNKPVPRPSVARLDEPVPGPSNRQDEPVPGPSNRQDEPVPGPPLRRQKAPKQSGSLQNIFERTFLILLNGLGSTMQYPEIVIVPDLDESAISMLSAADDDDLDDDDLEEIDVDVEEMESLKKERRLSRRFDKMREDFSVCNKNLRRTRQPICVLCSVRAQKRANDSGPLSFVGKLSMPSNIDRHRLAESRARGTRRASDVFGSPELVWKTGLLSGGGAEGASTSSAQVPLSTTPPTTGSPRPPSRSKSPPRTSPSIPTSYPPLPLPSTSRGLVATPEASPPTRAPETLRSRILGLFRCCCSMGMKLRCLEGNDGGNSYFLLENISGDKDSSTEKQEELQFYDDTDRYVSVVVEKNLRAIDLTQLLAVKNRVRKDYCWSIVEHWKDIGVERALEDHEDVLSVHRQTNGGEKRYIFRRYENKYEFFTKPTAYFPPDMIDLRPPREGYLNPEKDPDDLEIVLTTAQEFPAIFSQANLRQESNRNIWVKTFLLLTGSKILMSSKVQVVAKFLRSWRETSPGYRELEGEGPIDRHDDGLDQYVAGGEGNDEELEVLADLKDYEVYTSLNAKNQLKGPTEFGVVLRKTSEEDFTNSVVLSFDKGKDRVCWVTAMRLAKYGKLIRENYKAFKNKQESLPPSGSTANLSIDENYCSRVPMDFTGKVGRIVEDPREAKEIADYEGATWKHKIHVRCRPSAINGVLLEYGEDEKSHTGQPWYHKNMTREQATALLINFTQQEGVFVVRGSRSNPGGNVLSVRTKDKVVHVPILMVEDSVDKIMCYTIDSGLTRFYDICQLVEFYRLNAGCLPNRLTNHIIQRTPGAALAPQ